MTAPRIAKVFSHPRSGTHFFGAWLKANFYQNLDVTGRGGGAGHWANRFHIPGYSHAKLLGDHRFWRGDKDCFYVFRDGRDVAVSVWRTKKFQHPSWSKLSFAEFLRRPLDWRGTPNFRPSGKDNPRETIAEHWCSHLKSWADKQGVCYARFEDLKFEPEQVAEYVSKFLGTTLDDLRIITELVGVLPHEGKAGKWHEHFSNEDLEFFYSKAPINFWGLDDRG